VCEYRPRGAKWSPVASIEHDFSYAQPHPIAESYRAYHAMPYDRRYFRLDPSKRAEILEMLALLAS
jgi:hypothetical protein